MRRFNYDDSSEEDEIDNLFSDRMDDLEGEQLAEERFYQMAQLDLAQFELNQHLLHLALQLAEKSFFWRFYKIQTKLNIISKIYKNLNDLIIEEVEEK